VVSRPERRTDEAHLVTHRHRRRLGAVLVGIASLLPLVWSSAASGSPIDAKRAEARQIAARLDALGERVSVLDEQFDQARLRLDQVQQQVVTAQTKAAETRQRFTGVVSQAKATAVAAYTEGGDLSRAAKLLQGNGQDLLLRN
jgi:DNA anti-recombination protein RmuC